MVLRPRDVNSWSDAGSLLLQACNSASHTWKERTRSTLGHGEAAALRNISVLSEHDWALYTHAKDRFTAFLRMHVPDAHERLAAFLEAYGDTACSNGTFLAEHHAVFNPEAR